MSSPIFRNFKLAMAALSMISILEPIAAVPKIVLPNVCCFIRFVCFSILVLTVYLQVKW